MMNSWAYIWICHFLKTATLVEILPFGWSVYREALDFEGRLNQKNTYKYKILRMIANAKW